MLIAIEGLDGVGITTQAATLTQNLCEQGHPAILVRDLQERETGKLIRRYLSGELKGPGDPKRHREMMTLLFLADRALYTSEEIEPALEAGKVVVIARYMLSTVAYHMDNNGANFPWMGQAASVFVPADLYILLNASAEVGKERRAIRGGATEIYESDSKQAQVERNFDSLYETLASLLNIESVCAYGNKGAVARAVLRCAMSIISRE